MITIGLDVGTSAVKGVILSAGASGSAGPAQQVLAEASAPLTVSRLRPGWSEQNPEDWWLASRAVLASLRSQSPAYQHASALGLSGQMHALTVLDERGAALRPAILWNDGRATQECADLTERVPGLGHIAGIGAMPGFTAPKVLWLRRHEPELAGRIRHLLPAKDFVRLRLTGEAATDRADAAGMLLLDQRTRRWSALLLAAACTDERWLPRLCEGPEETGRLRPAMAADLGLPPGLPVVAGAGDAAAGGIGIGHTEPGDAYLSLGTSAQVFVTTPDYRPQPETLIHAFAHGLPGRWFQMAAMLNGASPLQAIAKVLGRTDLDVLLAETEAAMPTPGADRLLYLPYLSGERTPHGDPFARGVLFGMDGDTSPADVTRAVLEGVACSLADACTALSAAGSPLTTLGAIGGGSRSRYWMQLIADVTGIPVSLFAGSDKGPAFGAARLALMYAGGLPVTAAAPKPPVQDRLQPRPAETDRAAVRLARFRALYQALRPEFQR